MEHAGAEVAVLPADGSGRVSLPALLELLGTREVLTLLIEGGGVLLGSFFDQRLVDKLHAVIAPMIIGGATAPVAVAGRGAERMADALRLRDIDVERLGDDLLVTGYV
jgi:diaminohydroxyphosphoribosylaminopyrimidine deaminase/5-amino-6-(5-phosphoribosylamino)uracil reductase